MNGEERKEGEEVQGEPGDRVRDGEPLTAIEHACWYAWSYVQQTRARASDPGADRGADGNAVRRDPGG